MPISSHMIAGIFWANVGSLAGMVEHGMMYPLDTVKVSFYLIADPYAGFRIIEHYLLQNCIITLPERRRF